MHQELGWVKCKTFFPYYRIHGEGLKNFPSAAVKRGTTDVVKTLLDYWKGPKGERFDATYGRNQAVFSPAERGDAEITKRLLEWQDQNEKRGDPTEISTNAASRNDAVTEVL